MDGTPELLSNIQFQEAKKGYDRDQVDNFMRELGKQVGKVQDMLVEATRRAELAEAKAAEAAKATAAAIARAERAESDAAAAAAAAPDPVNEVEAASGMLALAQKTADAAIAEAEGKAKETIAEARTKATAMVVEAEQEIERIRKRASDQVETMLTKRSAEVDDEVQRLIGQRDALARDVDVLEQHLDEQRRRVRATVDSLDRLLRDDLIAPLPAPEVPTRETVTAASPPEPEPEPEPLAVAEPTVAPVAPPPVLPEPVLPQPVVVQPLSNDPVSNDPVDELVDGPVDAVGGDTASDAVTEEDGADTVVATIVTLEDLSGTAPGTPAPEAPRLIDLTDEHDVVPPSTPTPTPAALSSAAPRVTATVDSTLGSPDADADEAMRAFFESDFDADKDRGKGFLRRRA